MVLKNVLKNYKKDESGQFAVFTAVLALPLLMVTTATIDFYAANSESRSIKDSLNNAVMAATLTNNISVAQKERYAIEHFQENYNGRVKLSLTSKAESDWVSLEADGLVPFSVSEAVGLKGIDVQERSKAVRTEGNVICVLALAEDADKAVTFSGDLEFLAPNCSVHVNSSSPEALFSEANKAPIAESFCSTGGVRGSFSPYAKSECFPIIDPYINVEPPKIQTCVSDSKFERRVSANPFDINGLTMSGPGGSDLTVLRRGDNWVESMGPWQLRRLNAIRARLGLPPLDAGELDFDDDDPFSDDPGEDIVESENYTGGSAIFRPGTYCGGLTVDGRNVTFLPGDYLMLDGALTFKNGAQAVARDVTFSFKGPKARLKIEERSDVLVKAPFVGPRKGIAFMEVADEREKVKAKKFKQKEDISIANTITSGGNLSVAGSLYFPTQAIVVEGEGSRLGADTPAVSFIAHTLDLRGEKDSRVLVQVNHDVAGIPPIQPRAEVSARLVE